MFIQLMLTSYSSTMIWPVLATSLKYILSTYDADWWFTRLYGESPNGRTVNPAANRSVCETTSLKYKRKTNTNAAIRSAGQRFSRAHTQTDGYLQKAIRRFWPAVCGTCTEARPGQLSRRICRLRTRALWC